MMKQTIEGLFEKDVHLSDVPCSNETLAQGSKTGASYEQILRLFDSGGKPQLEEFIRRQRAMSCAQEKQAISLGFRLGARLRLEVIED